MTHSPLHDLAVEGQSVWIDYLSRHLVRCGELERLVAEDAVVGVTSNPTIFQKAISAEHDYDEQLRRELAETEDPHEAFLRLAERDIRGACDVLRPVFDRGGTPHGDGPPRGRGAGSAASERVAVPIMGVLARDACAE